MFNKKLFYASLLVAFFCLPNARAAEKKDTVRIYRSPSITVTTTRAEERRSPVPFSEITRADIIKSYSVQDVPQLLSELPSIISFSENGNGVGYSNLTMRGFNQRRISVMVNGIPQNDPEDHNVYWIDMPDITSSLESIQVQRGAGLTNYGSAAIGGSINLTTKNILDKRGITLSSGIGLQEFSGDNEFRHNVSRYSVEASSGLMDKYAVYGKLSSINSFGYRQRSWADLSSYFFSAARFDDNFSTQFNFYGGPLADGLAYTGMPKSYIKDKNLRRTNYNYWNYDTTGNQIEWITERRNRELENMTQPHYEMLNDWLINDNLTFKSTLFYYSADGFFDYDGTGWTDASSFRLTPENGFENAPDPQNPIIRSWVSNRHGGWIPRIVLDHENGILTAGAEVRIHRSNHWGKIAFAENLPENYDPEYKFYNYDGIRNIYSAFLREEFKINEKLTISGELQAVNNYYAIDNEKAGKVFTQYLDTDGKTVGNGDKLFGINYLFLNPRIGANYNLDETMNLYALAAYTSREPRMVNLYDASSAFSGDEPLFEVKILDNGTKTYDFSKPLIKPESMVNIELGWTFRNADNFINVNAYWMEYFDELVKSGQVDIFGAPIDGNAPRTRHFGVELQGSTVLFSSKYGKVLLSGNATYSKNNILEYGFKTKLGKTVDLADNTVAGFPDIMANARLSWVWNDLYVSVLCKHVGEFRSDNFGDMLTENADLKAHLIKKGDYYIDNKVEAYTIFNADISYTFRNILSLQSLGLRMQAGNLLNTLYAAGAEGKEFFAGAERNIFLGIELGL